MKTWDLPRTEDAGYFFLEKDILHRNVFLMKGHEMKLYFSNSI